VTKRLKVGSCGFHQNVALRLNFLPTKFDHKLRRGPLDMKAQFFGLCDAISRKRCKIGLRSQLITNRKLYMGFQLQQNSMTLNGQKAQYVVTGNQTVIATGATL